MNSHVNVEQYIGQGPPVNGELFWARSRNATKRKCTTQSKNMSMNKIIKQIVY